MESLHASTSEVCANCGGAELRPVRVRSAFWHDDRLVVVDGIPALVCVSCKEQYFDDATVVRLDLLRGAGFPESAATGELRAAIFELPEVETAGGGS